MTAPRPDANFEEMAEAGYAAARPPLFPVPRRRPWPGQLPRDEVVATIFERKGRLTFRRTPLSVAQRRTP